MCGSRWTVVCIGRLLVRAALIAGLGSSAQVAQAQSREDPEQIPCASLEARSGTEGSRRAKAASPCASHERSGEGEARNSQELSRWTSFLKWVHVDGLWVPAANQLDSFGVIGTHLTVANIGRLYIYGPPGVMLIRQRNGEQWMLRPAFTWGFSFYLNDFSVPGSGRTVQLFVNITKVWTEGDQRNGMDMVGLSVTFKK
jgi:hypothetical protein